MEFLLVSNAPRCLKKTECVFFLKSESYISKNHPASSLTVNAKHLPVLLLVFAAADAAFAAATALRPIAPDVQMEQWSIWAVMPCQQTIMAMSHKWKKEPAMVMSIGLHQQFWPTHRRSTLHVKCWECWAEKHTEFVWGADMTSTPIDFKSRIGPYACLR